MRMHLFIELDTARVAEAKALATAVAKAIGVGGWCDVVTSSTYGTGLSVNMQSGIPRDAVAWNNTLPEMVDASAFLLQLAADVQTTKPDSEEERETLQSAKER